MVLAVEVHPEEERLGQGQDAPAAGHEELQDLHHEPEGFGVVEVAVQLVVGEVAHVVLGPHAEDDEGEDVCKPHPEVPEEAVDLHVLEAHGLLPR